MVMNENRVLSGSTFSFEADLKVSASDFQVVEIDLNGVLSNEKVDLKTFQSCGLTTVTKLPLSQVGSIKRRFSTTSTTQEIPRAKKQLKSSVSQNFKFNEKNCKQYLVDRLSTEVIDCLNKANEINASKQEFVLGEFKDKEERTFLHTCVRYCYPHLCTVTENFFIKVKPCSKFDYLHQLIGHDVASSFMKFACVLSKQSPEEVFNITGEFNKDQRRQIHRGIDNYFGSYLMAKTKSSGKIIEVRRRHPKTLQSKSSHFCKFVLFKSNLETLDAIHQLAKTLKIRPHQFAYAGTKDKKAETWQFMTVNGVDVSKLQALTHFSPRLRISDVTVTSSPLKLGDLSKNRFIIVLRNVKAPNNNDNRASSAGKVSCLKSKIEKSLEFFGLNGFVNYFGSQRFGRKTWYCSYTRDHSDQSEMPESAAIGQAILKQNFKSAVNILLFSSSTTGNDGSRNRNETDMIKQDLFKSGDIDDAIKRFHPSKVRETSILRSLKKFGSNLRDLDNDQELLDEDPKIQAYAKALLSLPHNTLSFYAHSYCSLVWNKAASYRLTRFGEEVVQGDFVMLSDVELGEVHQVTEDDVIDSRYSLRDVVLPLPGNRVRLPPNMESFYSSTLIDDGIVKSDDDAKLSFRINRLRLNCPGAYRKLIEFPENLYFSWNKPTTIHELQSNVGASGNEMKLPTLRPPPPEQDDDSNNLTLTFDLRPSCYATTFLSQLSKDGVKEKRN